MKKILLGVLLMGCIATAFAQVGNVNPTPQEVSKGAQSLFDTPLKWNVVCDSNRAGGYAAQLLATATPENDAKAAFKVVLGVRGDKAVRRYAKHVPARTEGYFLSVAHDGVVVAGADEKGLFYGVQTLLDIMEHGKLEVCTVRDWPDVPFRGAVEGFYGTPWSHDARLDQMDFYRENKLNVYLYGPKDDVYHRDKWREPYPEEEGRRIHDLAEKARQCGVNFYWAIHPGQDIRWNEEDRGNLVRKFELMYDLGVRSFAVFFDDIWGEGTNADRQAELLNYLDDNFVCTKGDVAPLVMCPTQYNRSWAEKQEDYLWTLGARLNKTVHVMWTGDKVVADITKDGLDWVNKRIDRKAYIWWNYPVTDFVRSNVLLGPVYGNDTDIADALSGFMSNPMEHAEASKIALYGIADYLWNMSSYDSRSNWEKALRDLLPDNWEALRTFALYNMELGRNGHGFYREEGWEIEDIAAAALDGDRKAVEALAVKSRELKRAADLLLADRSNPRLLKELKPWLLQARLAADYGETVTALVLADKSEGLWSFDALYRQVRSVRRQMYELGATSPARHWLQTDIHLGIKVYMPTLNTLFANAVEKWNKTHGTDYDPIAEYNPCTLVSTVAQLSPLPARVQDGIISVAPCLEVVTWQKGGDMTITLENTATTIRFSFDPGVENVASHFRLEIFDGEWHTIELRQNAGETIAYGLGLWHRKTSKIRLTNVSDKDLNLYFRNFRFEIN